MTSLRESFSFDECVKAHPRLRVTENWWLARARSEFRLSARGLTARLYRGGAPLVRLPLRYTYLKLGSARAYPVGVFVAPLYTILYSIVYIDALSNGNWPGGHHYPRIECAAAERSSNMRARAHARKSPRRSPERSDPHACDRFEERARVIPDCSVHTEQLYVYA